MSKFWIGLFSIFLLMSSITAADQAGGFVTVVTGVPDAEISVDGLFVSKDFVRQYPVPPGDHYVRIEYQGKLMYSRQVSVAPFQTVLVNSENFVDLKTAVPSRGAIDREARRLQEVKGDFGVGVVAGLGFPAAGVSLKWAPSDFIGVQLSGVGNVRIDGTTYTEYGGRLLFPLGKRVLWNTVMSGYFAPGVARLEHTGNHALNATVYGGSLGLEWAPLDPLYFSGEVSIGYRVDNQSQSQIISSVMVGAHFFF